jgi:hypothetical protein
VLGQCTSLLQSKLKQQQQWTTISDAQDAIALISLIKTVTFRFEDQVLPLALYQARANLYNLRRSGLAIRITSNVSRIVDVATAYNGQLYDMAIVDICHQRLNPGVDILPVTEEWFTTLRPIFTKLQCFSIR